jgi:hypothetical protein
MRLILQKAVQVEINSDTALGTISKRADPSKERRVLIAR